jgi:hypothetical protein
MSQKKFEPSMGYMVTIDQQCHAVVRLAGLIEIDPVVLGQSLEKSGYRLEADPFDLSADTVKVIARRLEVEANK